MRFREAAYSNHRASNSAGMHPSLPVLEHSITLMSCYKPLKLPLWGLSIVIHDLSRKWPSWREGGRGICISFTTSIHVGHNWHSIFPLKAQQIAIPAGMEQITGDEELWSQHLPRICTSSTLVTACPGWGTAVLGRKQLNSKPCKAAEVSSLYPAAAARGTINHVTRKWL